MRRSFRDYLSGVGLGAIASTLNAEAIPTPYDRSGYGKRAGKGWGQSTVRAIVSNERYVGRFVWNKRKWNRVPGKKARASVIHDRSEWVSRDVPELAIVDATTWAAAAAKLVAALRDHVGLLLRRRHGQNDGPGSPVDQKADDEEPFVFASRRSAPHQQSLPADVEERVFPALTHPSFTRSKVVVAEVMASLTRSCPWSEPRTRSSRRTERRLSLLHAPTDRLEPRIERPADDWEPARASRTITKAARLRERPAQRGSAETRHSRRATAGAFPTPTSRRRRPDRTWAPRRA